MAKRREIRNSTAEFLIFQAEAKEQGVEVYYKDENIWATQKAMATLFDVNVPAISKHLKNIFESGELKDDAVVSKMEITASDGKRYQTQFYSLDAIIAVGYRVNSIRATQFRQWATSVLREYAIRGYVLDRKRMENGTFLDEDYFEHLLAEIREIRLSERRFYQKLTDIYATAIDYNRDAPTTKMFFKMMQNKMHYAVHGHTAKRHIPMTMEDWAKQIDTILAAGGNEVLQSPGKVTAEEAKEHAETEFEKYRILQDRLFQSDFDKFLGELPFIDETDTK